LIRKERIKAMPAPKSNLKEVNVKRVLSGAQKAGVEIARVEVDKDGKITLIPGSPSNAQTTENALDGWMASHARSA
jgi:hypothetical protein